MLVYSVRSGDIVINVMLFDRRLNACFGLKEPFGPKLLDIFISNLSDDRSTASSKTIPPLNAI
jgi:hypothetical protein